MIKKFLIIIFLAVLVALAVFFFASGNISESEKLEYVKQNDLVVIFMKQYPESKINFSNALKTEATIKIEKDSRRLHLRVPATSGQDNFNVLICDEMPQSDTIWDLVFREADRDFIIESVKLNKCFE